MHEYERLFSKITNGEQIKNSRCLIKALGAAWVKVTTELHIVVFLHLTKE